MLEEFPLQLGEDNAASIFDILNHDIFNGGPAIAKLNCECSISGQFTLCMAAFMPGPRNMHAVRDVSSY